MLRNIWNNLWGRTVIIGMVCGLVGNLVFDDLIWGPRRRAEQTERAKQFHAERAQEKKEVIAEYERQKALANATTAESAETTLSVKEPETPVLSTDDRQPDTTSTPMPDNEHARRITIGSYKNRTRAEIRAAEKTRRAWYIRDMEHRKRRKAYFEKYRANLAALRASGKEKVSLMLASLSLLSPEQLDYARQELLKTHTAAAVDEFFNALAQHANTKTPEQIDRDVQQLLKSRETYKIVKRELAIEREALRWERAELERTRPSH